MRRDITLRGIRWGRVTHTAPLAESRMRSIPQEFQSTKRDRSRGG
jgi:hypothetical protein